MAKKTGTQRTTISVPADLKARMDKVKVPVNWSALACAAFEKKLAEVSVKKEKDMADIVSRLRASKQNAEGQEFATGFAEGQTWAKDIAEAGELERLDRFYTAMTAEPHCDWQWLFMHGEENSAYTLAEQLHAQIAGLPSPDRNEAHEFFSFNIDEEEGQAWQPERLRGFAQGALEVWWQVKDQL